MARLCIKHHLHYMPSDAPSKRRQIEILLCTDDHLALVPLGDTRASIGALLRHGPRVTLETETLICRYAETMTLSKNLSTRRLGRVSNPPRRQAAQHNLGNAAHKQVDGEDA